MIKNVRSAQDNWTLAQWSPTSFTSTTTAITTTTTETTADPTMTTTSSGGNVVGVTYYDLHVFCYGQCTFSFYWAQNSSSSSPPPPTVCIIPGPSTDHGGPAHCYTANLTSSGGSSDTYTYSLPNASIGTADPYSYGAIAEYGISIGKGSSPLTVPVSGT